MKTIEELILEMQEKLGSASTSISLVKPINETPISSQDSFFVEEYDLCGAALMSDQIPFDAVSDQYDQDLPVVDMIKLEKEILQISQNMCKLTNKLINNQPEQEPANLELLQCFFYKYVKDLNRIGNQLECARGKFPSPPLLTRCHSAYDSIVDGDTLMLDVIQPSIYVSEIREPIFSPISISESKRPIERDNMSVVEELSWCSKIEKERSQEKALDKEVGR